MKSTLPLSVVSSRGGSRPAAWLAGLVLAGTSVVLASPHADSAVGVGTVLGNALTANPAPLRGYDAAWVTTKHTPSGQLFSQPFALPDVRKAASGWEYSGQIEFGVLGGDADEENARFRMYQDIDQGAFLNNFSLNLQKPSDAFGVELTGGAAGRRDQYYGLELGRHNAWKVKLFFSETPHVFTDRYRSLWNGVGTGTLTLVPGLTPGGTTSTAADNAAVAAAAANPPTTLALTRKRWGVRTDLTLSSAWKAYVSYALEERKGARPFGAIWGNNPGNGQIEIPESIDYDTHDLLAGLMYADGLNALNLRFQASRFENNLDTQTFQEPYRIAPAAGVTTVPATGAFTQARFDLTPSNDAYNVRAEYTRSLPDFHKSYLTAVVSAGSWRQDDALLPWTALPGLSLANVVLQANGAWDTVGSLSRRTANMKIDTRLADLTFSANPTNALNLKAKARIHETDNASDPFLAVNPNAVYLDADAATAGNQTRGLTFDGVTGVWGRLINDGSGQNVLLGQNSTPAGNIPIKSAPYGSKQARFGLTADYRAGKNVGLNAALEREKIDRDYRERDHTTEDRLKLGYSHRGLGDATLRASWEFARRRGDDYAIRSWNEFFSSALIPMPTTPGSNVTSWAVRANSALHGPDLADRDQHTVNVRLNTMLRPSLDAGISAQERWADYPGTDYGRTAQRQRSANLDLNYQPSTRRSIFGFYSYQLGRNRQASIAAGGNITIGQVTGLGTVTPDNAAAIGTSPGGPVFPLASAWTNTATDRNHVAGIGLREEIGRTTLNLDYNYTIGHTRIAYTYTVGGAVNAANAVFAGSRMPDLAFQSDYLNASLRIPLTDRLSARLVYRYQKETIRDWHYRNIEGAPLVLGGGAASLPTVVILDGGPQDYRVNWYGVTLQLKF
ncbi:MAG: MtrB/PioB family outer membrane beta-barrel protein [Verrucomicrobia bacterium]|nr:MtrB/PioB family outer membrane beta-barrel protein [Verrucomicrobiota bacterium]